MASPDDDRPAAPERPASEADPAAPERPAGPPPARGRAEPAEDPLVRHGPALAGVLLAVVLSTLLAALVGGAVPGDYDVRAGVYTGLVVWNLVGAVVVFLRAAAGERQPLSVGRIGLWMASIWLWPLLVIGGRRPPPPST